MTADVDKEVLPSVQVSRDERPGAAGAAGGMHALVREQRVPANTGALWALTAALTLALLGLGYWSYQQQSALRQQLIATQDSFARISEDAAGRIELITGQVSATESQLTAAEQAQQDQLAGLQQNLTAQTGRLQQLEQGAAQQQAQLQALQQALQASDSARERLAIELAESRNQQQASETALQGVREEVLALQQSTAGLAEWHTRLAALASEQEALAGRVAQLAEQEQPDIAAAEQGLLALAARLDREQEETAQALQSIDSFRVQVNRSLNTLQAQLATLQQAGQP